MGRIDFLVDENSASAIDDLRLKTLPCVAIYPVGMETGKCYLYSSDVDASPHSGLFVGTERGAVAGEVGPWVDGSEYMAVAESLVVACFERTNYTRAGSIRDHFDQAQAGMVEYLSD